MNSIDARRLHEAWGMVLKGKSPNFFLTFNYGYPVRPLNAQRLMTNFFDKMLSSSFGSNLCEKPHWFNLCAFGFLEHADSNPHYHVLTHLEDKTGDWVLGAGVSVWKRIAPRGQLWIEEVHGPENVSSYVRKRLISSRNFADIYVY